MADGISYAPEHILKLVRCGCSSERPYKVGTVAVWGTNLFAQCFVLVVVVLHVQIHSVPRRV